MRKGNRTCGGRGTEKRRHDKRDIPVGTRLAKHMRGYAKQYKTAG